MQLVRAHHQIREGKELPTPRQIGVVGVVDQGRDLVDQAAGAGAARTAGRAHRDGHVDRAGLVRSRDEGPGRAFVGGHGDARRDVVLALHRGIAHGAARSVERILDAGIEHAAGRRRIVLHHDLVAGLRRDQGRSGQGGLAGRGAGARIATHAGATGAARGAPAGSRRAAASGTARADAAAARASDGGATLAAGAGARVGLAVAAACDEQRSQPQDKSGQHRVQAITARQVRITARQGVILCRGDSRSRSRAAARCLRSHRRAHDCGAHDCRARDCGARNRRRGAGDDGRSARRPASTERFNHRANAGGARAPGPRSAQGLDRQERAMHQ